MRVLVVEDNRLQSRLARISLERKGLQVDCASSIEEAVLRLNDPGIDVILLDLSLPDSSGIETFYKIRSLAVNVPTVVYTALEDKNIALEALQNGAQDYLIKGSANDESVFRCLQYAVERNKVEIALKESERRLRIILENSYDAFISCDSKWRITDWNTQAERTFGWSSADALGHTLAFIVPHHLRKQYAHHVEEHFNSNQGNILRMTDEVIAVHKDGHEFPIEIGIFRIKEDYDYMHGAFARDISERKRAKEELELQVQERTSELTRSNEELKQFAKITSHDLQEPLRAIQGFANLLAERTSGKLDQDCRDFLGFILKGTDRMQQLIESVLLHSSISPTPSEEISTDCNSVLEEVLANLDASIKASQAQLEIDNLPLVAVERWQLIQLFQNLISNAIKYRGEAPLKISVSVEPSVDEWLFSVHDNGIGIEEKYLDKIFDMFARLHGQTKYSGTGMGLAICKKIVTSHGGKIWVESKPLEGSVFLFTLPAPVNCDRGA